MSLSARLGPGTGYADSGRTEKAHSMSAPICGLAEQATFHEVAPASGQRLKCTAPCLLPVNDVDIMCDQDFVLTLQLRCG